MAGSKQAASAQGVGAAGGIEALADRIRAALPAEGVTEQRMFGGICFMLNGNMVAGTSKRGLLARVGKDGHAQALTRPGAGAMEMGGRTMAGYVFVDPQVLDDAVLRDWLQLARAHVQTLPPKSKPKRTGTTKARP